MEGWSTKAIYDALFLFAFRMKGNMERRSSESNVSDVCSVV